MYTKKCNRCKIEKPSPDFYFNGNCRDNLMGHCKSCHRDWMHNNYVQEHEGVEPVKRALMKTLRSAKGRAVRNNMKFDITIDDINIPAVCPIFKTKFIPGDTFLAASLDRVDNKKGYVKGNVVVISRKANTLKSYGTALDHKKISEWMYKTLDNYV